MAKGNKIVAEICLYGIQQKGFGYIAQSKAGLVGDGELSYSSCTQAVWAACLALATAGIAVDGEAWVYMPGGKSRAKIALAQPGYFGNMKWEAAPVLVISAADIEAAAVAV